MIPVSEPVGVVEKNDRVWLVMTTGTSVHKWVEITDTAPWEADE